MIRSLQRLRLWLTIRADRWGFGWQPRLRWAATTSLLFVVGLELYRACILGPRLNVPNAKTHLVRRTSHFRSCSADVGDVETRKAISALTSASKLACVDRYEALPPLVREHPRGFDRDSHIGV